MRLSVLFALIAFVLFVWSAGVHAGWIDWGNAWVLLSLGLASMSLVMMPLDDRRIL